MGDSVWYTTRTDLDDARAAEKFVDIHYPREGWQWVSRKEGTFSLARSGRFRLSLYPGGGWEVLTVGTPAKPAPAHYPDPQPDAVIDAWGLGFRLGNVVKYVARADHKGDAVGDLKKAADYLAREIAKREAANG